MKDKRSFFARRARELGLILCDAVIIAVTSYIAMLARFAPNISAEDVRAVSMAVPCLILANVIVYGIFRMYAVAWRYADAAQFVRQALATVVAFGIVFLLNEIFKKDNGTLLLSRYYLLTQWLFTMVCIVGFRLALRALRRYYSRTDTDSRSGEKRILLICSEQTAASALDGIIASREGSVVCIADESPARQGYSFRGIPIDGTLKDVNAICNEENVTDIVIALPSLPEGLSEECLKTGCRVRAIR